MKKGFEIKSGGNAGLNRIIIVIGVMLLYFLQAEIRFLPSPLMEELSADFGIPLTMVGNLLSVCMVAAAVFMFGTSVVVERIGSVNLLIIAAVCVSFTGIVTGLSGNFYVAVFAYIFCGACQGILECIGIVLVSELFSPKYRAVFCSGICAVSQISFSIAYSLPVFLKEGAGGWRNLELLWGGSSAVLAVVLFLFAGRQKPAKSTEGKKEKPGLVQALQNPFILLTVLTMMVFIWVNNHFSIYLPTYLRTTKGFTEGQAGVATSVMYFGGFAGAMAAGVLSVKYRKTIYRYAPYLMMLGALGLCLLKVIPGVLLGAVLFAFAYQMWVPMALASFMNLDGISTSALAGATALFNGGGHFFTGFIPSVFTFKLRFMSMETAYITTVCLLLVSVILTTFSSRRREFR